MNWLIAADLELVALGTDDRPWQPWPAPSAASPAGRGAAPSRPVAGRKAGSAAHPEKGRDPSRRLRHRRRRCLVLDSLKKKHPRLIKEINFWFWMQCKLIHFTWSFTINDAFPINFNQWWGRARSAECWIMIIIMKSREEINSRFIYVYIYM